MAALTRDILGFKYYRAETEGGNRQKCEQMIQVKSRTVKMFHVSRGCMMPQMNPQTCH